MDHSHILKDIENYMEDAQYSITVKPYKNILKTLMSWIVFICISDFIFNHFMTIALNQKWYLNTWYFYIYNGLCAFFYIASLVIYYLLLNQSSIRYRERQFLKVWIFIPVLIILLKFLTSLFIQYSHLYFLLSYNHAFILDFILLIIGIYMIYQYRKKKIYLWGIVFSIVYLFINIITFVYTYSHYLNYSGYYLFFSQLLNILLLMNQYNIDMLLLLCLLYWDYKHDEKFS